MAKAKDEEVKDEEVVETPAEEAPAPKAKAKTGPTRDYSFAVNKLKLQRAIAETTAENNGKTPADEVVKERYVALAALLVADESQATAKARSIMAPKSKAKGADAQ